MNATQQVDHDGIPLPPEPPSDEMVPYIATRTTTVPTVDELAARERNRRAAIEQVDREQAAATQTYFGRVKMRDVVAQAMEELHVKRENGVTGFPTGVATFDKKARPLFQPGNVCLLAASTKTGKTTVANQWLTAWAGQGIPVLHFSFEDDEMDTVLRDIANIGSGNIGDLRAAFLDEDGNKMEIPKAVDAAAGELSAMDIDMVTRRLTVTQIGDEIFAWKRSWPKGSSAGVVIIDQLSHIVADDPAAFRARFGTTWPAPPRADNDVKLREWQTDILTLIAKKYGVLIVLAHQLNTEKKEWELPDERSLAASKAVAHKVHGVIIPWRPQNLVNENRLRGEPETVPNTDERMWMVCPISRVIGGRWKVEVEWQGVHQRIADLDSRIGSPWVAPAPVTEQQMKGMATRRALRDRWDAFVTDTAKAANGADVQPVAPVKLRTLGTLGARWRLPVARLDELVKLSV